MKSFAIWSVAGLALCGAFDAAAAGPFHSLALPSPSDVTLVASTLESRALNPQPLPPKIGLTDKMNTRELNPQPLPPSSGSKAKHPGDPIKPSGEKTKAKRVKTG